MFPSFSSKETRNQQHANLPPLQGLFYAPLSSPSLSQEQDSNHIPNSVPSNDYLGIRTTCLPEPSVLMTTSQKDSLIPTLWNHGVSQELLEQESFTATDSIGHQGKSKTKPQIIILTSMIIT
jgi:hypothetical protein